MPVCASCGTQQAEDLEFCIRCGAPLAEAQAREERKLVTAVFADLVGFTGRSEEMDIEDVRRMLVLYHRLLRRELERFGGTVEKFIGDAVVAVFGAPVAHEDDPERAVRAALAIQAGLARLRSQQPELDLHVRIGVNTGEALVAIDANPAAGEVFATGDVINTAARLETAAPVDGVLVGELTARATDRVIDYQPCASVRVRGKREELAVWIARAAGTIGSEPKRLPGTPLVGRRAELAQLWAALGTVQERRRAALVTVIGAPGIGKSRMISELFLRIQSQPAEIGFRKGRSLPYGEGVTFWALAEILSGEAGILHSDSADAAGAKLHRRIRALVGDDPRAAWMERQLRPLLGLDHRHDAGGEGQAEAFAAWRLFLEALAADRPLVLVFEDLHWADDAMLEFVEGLVSRLGDLPFLVLCTARPELFDRRPEWGSRPAQTIELTPLSGSDTAALVHSLLGDVPLPGDTLTALLERAAGNPLYAQEYVRMLLDRGYLVRRDGRWSLSEDAELPLPESVHSIIASRLDALDGGEKAVLQAASVIGKVFWVGAVARVADRDRAAVEEQLRHLQQKEFIRIEPAASIAGEAQFAFQHALIRDVAYAQMVRRVRAGLHVRAAGWIEALAGDRDDRIELLAHHYLTAHRLRVAATGGEDEGLRPRARECLLEAADRALGMSAFRAAVHFYAPAIELFASLEEVPPLVRYRYGRARMYSEEVLPDSLAETARRLAESGDLEAASEAESEIGIWLDQQGSKQEALVHLGRAVDLLAGAPPSAAKAGALTALASVQVLRGQVTEAVETATESRRIATAIGVDDLLAWSHQTLAWALLQQQDVRGLEEFEHAYDLARRLESYDGAMIEHNYGVALLARGDMAAAHAVQAHARSRAERLGLSYTVRLVDAALACMLYHEGNAAAARALAEQVIGETIGSAHGEAAEAHTVCARIAVHEGQVQEAAGHADRALELARAIGEPQYFVSALGVRAQLEVIEGRPDRASGLIAELLDEWWVGVAMAAEALSSAAIAAAEAPGVRDRFVAAATAYGVPSRWVEAAAALASGDVEGAARRYAVIGSIPDLALARSLGAAAPLA